MLKSWSQVGDLPRVVPSLKSEMPLYCIAESMEKITVYILSSRISTLDFVDFEGARHARAKAGSSAFAGLKNYPGTMKDSYISEEERSAILLVGSFCKKKGFDFEIVDLGRLSLPLKIKIRMTGVKILPTVACRGKRFCGLPTEKDLEALIGT